MIRLFALAAALLVFCSAAAAEIDLTLSVAGVEYGADQEIDCGRLATITADNLSDDSVFWFMLTENVDFHTSGNKMLIATPCRPVTITVSLQAIDWENRRVLGQKTVRLRVACGDQPVPTPQPVPPSPQPTPPAIDIPRPSDQLAALVRPIGAKLQSDPDKAAKVAWCFVGFSRAIRGPSGQKVSSVSLFGSINAAALQSLGMSSGVGIGGEITKVLGTYANVTTNDRPLSAGDREKIAEVFDAVAWIAASQ